MCFRRSCPSLVSSISPWWQSTSSHTAGTSSQSSIPKILSPRFVFPEHFCVLYILLYVFYTKTQLIIRKFCTLQKNSGRKFNWITFCQKLQSVKSLKVSAQLDLSFLRYLEYIRSWILTCFTFINCLKHPFARFRKNLQQYLKNHQTNRTNFMFVLFQMT